MAAVEKFKLAGASPTDIAVMIKNHCANGTTQEGLGFKIDEIVQAWNEMHDAKMWIVPDAGFLPCAYDPRLEKRHGFMVVEG
ncbi:hypothetical protein HPP92_001037 [Vanilla planifolia]|uniref:Uncharacterized protein n=1 Tax=Vanilla planifolia TaxID=51239 RepID=A0A835VL06_VANPL|nr:hypothetical protein HPP92_001037 [Vanilla planifolia]